MRNFVSVGFFFLTSFLTWWYFHISILDRGIEGLVVLLVSLIVMILAYTCPIWSE